MNEENKRFRLEQRLHEQLHQKNTPFDFDQWAKKYPDQLQQLRSGTKPVHQNKFTDLWRMIMKSPYAKFGTLAASLMIAFLFLFPVGNMFPQSMLFADVQKKILDQENCRITGTRILSTKDENPTEISYLVHKYLSRKYGCVDQTFDSEGNLLIWLSVHHPSKVITVQFPQMKRYVQFPIPEKYQEQMEEISMIRLFSLLFRDGRMDDLEEIDLQTLDLTTLDCVQKATIKDIPAVGFEFTELHNKIKTLGFDRLPLFFDMQETNGIIWINPDTLLPVQLECDANIGKCILTNFKEMHLFEVDDSFQWNIEMEESLFKPEIPEEYEMFGIPEVKTTAVVGTTGIIAGIPCLLWIRKKRRKKKKLE